MQRIWPSFESFAAQNSVCRCTVTFVQRVCISHCIKRPLVSPLLRGLSCWHQRLRDWVGSIWEIWLRVAVAACVTCTAFVLQDIYHFVSYSNYLANLAFYILVECTNLHANIYTVAWQTRLKNNMNDCSFFLQGSSGGCVCAGSCLAVQRLAVAAAWWISCRHFRQKWVIPTVKFLIYWYRNRANDCLKSAKKKWCYLCTHWKKTKTLCIVVDSHSYNKNIVWETKQSLINQLIHLLSNFLFFVTFVTLPTRPSLRPSTSRSGRGASFMLYELAVCCMFLCM